MIIDLILDRKDGDNYNAHEFLEGIKRYNETFDGIGEEIITAFNSKNGYSIKRALAKYIIDNDYNLDIISYINSVDWNTPINIEITALELKNLIENKRQITKNCDIYNDGKLIGTFVPTVA